MCNWTCRIQIFVVQESAVEIQLVMSKGKGTDERKQECEDGCYFTWDGCAQMGQSVLRKVFLCY